MVQEKYVGTLQQTLDAITFKNEQARKIKAIQEGKEKLKDGLGRAKATKQSAVSRIKGLKGLQGLQSL